MDSLTPIPLPGTVRLAPGGGGLPRLLIANPQAEAEIYLMGAHCTHFQPRGQAPVLWLSPQSRFQTGTPIRGGVPLCWPWFGPHPSRTDLPAHGFARTATWQLAQAHTTPQGDTVIALTLASSPATLLLWPHPFRLTLVVTVGSALSIALTTENTGTQPFSFEDALHTYLAVADASRIDITGLSGVSYRDKVRGGEHGRQDTPLRIVGEVDRVYLDTTTAVTVSDPAGARALTVSKQGSSSTVVWNPGAAKAATMADLGAHAWPHLVCIETANALGNALTLPAGARHHTSMTVTCNPAPTPAGLS